MKTTREWLDSKLYPYIESHPNRRWAIVRTTTDPQIFEAVEELKAKGIEVKQLPNLHNNFLITW